MPQRLKEMDLHGDFVPSSMGRWLLGTTGSRNSQWPSAIAAIAAPQG